jgi:hypothetical protein
VIVRDHRLFSLRSRRFECRSYAVRTKMSEAILAHERLPHDGLGIYQARQLAPWRERWGLRRDAFNPSTSTS